MLEVLLASQWVVGSLQPEVQPYGALQMLHIVLGQVPNHVPDVLGIQGTNLVHQQKC